MPLNYNYHPSNFNVGKEVVSPEDVTIPGFDGKYLEKYTGVHPFTVEFIKRFDLDDRLFQPFRSNNQFSGVKRAHDK